MFGIPRNKIGMSMGYTILGQQFNKQVQIKRNLYIQDSELIFITKVKKVKFVQYIIPVKQIVRRGQIRIINDHVNNEYHNKNSKMIQTKKTFLQNMTF